MLFLILALPLLASAALVERQFPSMGKAKVATVAKDTPQYFKQAGVQRTKVKVGRM
jgi:hypothetical protein